MKFITQNKKIKIINIDCKIIEKNQMKMRHSSLLPNTLRCLIVGSSNCGKTNILINLIINPNGLRFENIYIYSKSLHQPKYQYLGNVMTNVPEIGYFTYSNNSDIMPPKEALNNSLFIFDDVICDKQHIIQEYFSMGRHSNIDCFYLCQSYAKIPKHLIRDNANFLILFKQDLQNINHIYNNHVNTDMSFKKFYTICNKCWANKYGFIIIDKDKNIEEGRYKRGFNENIVL